MGDGAFKHSGLTNAVIEEGLKTIPDETFCGTDLVSVTIPQSVTSIKYEAFEYCFDLEKVIYKGDKTDWSKISIDYGNDYLTEATISYHQHSYTTQIIKDSTCSTAGSKKQTCSTCGKVQTLSIDKKAHKYSWILTKKASLKESGQKVKKCSVCKHIETKQTIAKISSVKLSKKSYKYNKKTHKPTVTVKDSKGKKISSKYYTVKYGKGLNKVGK